MIQQLLNNLPKKAIHLYDCGAKYASMRKVINNVRPEIIYHGVRARVSEIDVSYIDAHEPHEDDLIYDNYDHFYRNLPSNAVLMFIDSSYYVTDDQVDYLKSS